ncbi:hypothetical protein FisN_7Hh078 [Fistulifera solaris]|uniref:Uncharacterized protein n=1 Tax=Fistulifera solaris TaxID=1519565 RepID=A0A1Z5K3E4_FISSO|nr:hypothetical protein FisN_7Hh078 [Fistulifera solaris]|eukprot:GAX20767.1 hypothetical protein FisN_7Hh078 [Fistulifera solaris]
MELMCRSDAIGKDTAFAVDGPITCYEFIGMDMLEECDDADGYGSDSSYCSYCNNSVNLSKVPKKVAEQRQRRRSSMNGGVRYSALTKSEMPRSASVNEMMSWLNMGSDNTDVLSSFSLEVTKLTPLKTFDKSGGQLTRSFSSEVLSSQAVAGGAGRAA